MPKKGRKPGSGLHSTDLHKASVTYGRMASALPRLEQECRDAFAAMISAEADKARTEGDPTSTNDAKIIANADSVKARIAYEKANVAYRERKSIIDKAEIELMLQRQTKLEQEMSKQLFMFQNSHRESAALAKKAATMRTQFNAQVREAQSAVVVPQPAAVPADTEKEKPMSWGEWGKSLIGIGPKKKIGKRKRGAGACLIHFQGRDVPVNIGMDAKFANVYDAVMRSFSLPPNCSFMLVPVKCDCIILRVCDDDEATAADIFTIGEHRYYKAGAYEYFEEQHCPNEGVESFTTAKPGQYVFSEPLDTKMGNIVVFTHIFEANLIAMPSPPGSLMLKTLQKANEDRHERLSAEFSELKAVVEDVAGIALTANDERKQYEIPNSYHIESKLDQIIMTIRSAQIATMAAEPEPQQKQDFNVFDAEDFTLVVDAVISAIKQNSTHKQDWIDTKREYILRDALREHQMLQRKAVKVTEPVSHTATAVEYTEAQADHESEDGSDEEFIPEDAAAAGGLNDMRSMAAAVPDGTDLYKVSFNLFDAEEPERLVKDINVSFCVRGANKDHAFSVGLQQLKTYVDTIDTTDQIGAEFREPILEDIGVSVSGPGHYSPSMNRFLTAAPAVEAVRFREGDFILHEDTRKYDANWFNLEADVRNGPENTPLTVLTARQLGSMVHPDIARGTSGIVFQLVHDYNPATDSKGPHVRPMYIRRGMLQQGEGAPRIDVRRAFQNGANRKGRFTTSAVLPTIRGYMNVTQELRNLQRRLQQPAAVPADVADSDDADTRADHWESLLSTLGFEAWVNTHLLIEFDDDENPILPTSTMSMHARRNAQDQILHTFVEGHLTPLSATVDWMEDLIYLYKSCYHGYIVEWEFVDGMLVPVLPGPNMMGDDEWCGSQDDLDETTSIEISRFVEERILPLLPTAAAAPAAAAVEVEPPTEWFCPITKCIFQDPVIICDTFTYEREAIMHWVNSGNSKSPMTGADLPRWGFNRGQLVCIKDQAIISQIRNA